ncbi:MAG: WecB/TagA/CpsF family glycosyltransferase [Hyphomicrobiales bacterium]|nr:WecB/TagA/CpsF family glycosyltransferase [Hyphomicrobiales bacterium]MDE2115605.1 WecB/TagA/CpsF family glycosyltransferase [Hyphomicrobiales bacterium]
MNNANDMPVPTDEPAHAGALGAADFAEPAPIYSIDGQSINIADMAMLMAQVRRHLEAKRGFNLFTLNLDHLVKRRADPAFRAAYQRAQLVTADGLPLVALARRRGIFIRRATGADLIGPLCELAVELGVSLYFFGSTRENLICAAETLKRRYPGLEISGLEAPQFGFEPVSQGARAAGEKMAASGAGLCLIALGAPKQELLADQWVQQHPGIGYFCIGAALDFIAGGQKRAPFVLQKWGFEWAYRLASNPRRMFMRYLRCAVLLSELAVTPGDAPKIPEH